MWNTGKSVIKGLTSSDPYTRGHTLGLAVGTVAIAAVGTKGLGFVTRVTGVARAADEGNIVFRSLAAGEDPALGLTARNPAAGNDIVSHIAGARDSQWTSTTRSEQIDREMCGSNGVVRIDL